MLAVFEGAPREIVGDTDIERPVHLRREHVDEVSAFLSHRIIAIHVITRACG